MIGNVPGPRLFRCDEGHKKVECRSKPFFAVISGRCRLRGVPSRYTSPRNEFSAPLTKVALLREASQTNQPDLSHHLG